MALSRGGDALSRPRDRGGDGEAAHDDAGDHHAHEDDVAYDHAHELEQGPGDPPADIAARDARDSRTQDEVRIRLGARLVEGDHAEHGKDDEREAEGHAARDGLVVSEEEGRGEDEDRDRDERGGDAKGERHEVTGRARHNRAGGNEERREQGNGEHREHDAHDVGGCSLERPLGAAGALGAPAVLCCV